MLPFAPRAGGKSEIAFWCAGPMGSFVPTILRGESGIKSNMIVHNYSLIILCECFAQYEHNIGMTSLIYDPRGECTAVKLTKL